MEMKDGFPTFYAKDRASWRAWLAEHHLKEKSLWLIIYKKQSGVPSVYYEEAVAEGLCFGWIDSKPNKRDTESYYQFFSKRNPKSNWSAKNKRTIADLEAQGLITEEGYRMIAIAKENGTWTALEDVDNLVVPNDLKAAFDENPTAWAYYDAFPPSTKRGILEWIFNAKRPATRAKRIAETVRLAADNIRANQYRPK